MSPEPLKTLFAAAVAARDHAYAPFSRFRVGAAIRLRDGSVQVGANYESASYGLTLCAERAALVAVQRVGAIAEIEAIAVTAIQLDAEGVPVPLADPVTPCGACRQWLFEAAVRGGPGNDFPVYCGNSDFSRWEETSTRLLLPRGFAFGET